MIVAGWFFMIVGQVALDGGEVFFFERRVDVFFFWIKEGGKGLAGQGEKGWVSKIIVDGFSCELGGEGF